MSASKSSHLHNYEPMLNKSQLVIIIVYTYQHIRLNYKWFLFFVYQLLSSKNKYSYILFNYTFTFICNDLLLLIIQLFDTAWVKFQRFRCEKIWKIEKGNNLFVNLSDENGMCCKTNQSSSTIFFYLFLLRPSLVIEHNIFIVDGCRVLFDQSFMNLLQLLNE